MADGGGQPQLRQVRGAWPKCLRRGAWFMLSHAHLTFGSAPPQPAKLTEAFKYFVQGMGYSEFRCYVNEAGLINSLGGLGH